ncbi:MAG TPA: hypothetical protein VHV30_17140 [Polyangiaceae bacterium]|jgi:hypothetical protein|nr:hypothetical protein [Polyangiaceae bacterium]
MAKKIIHNRVQVVAAAKQFIAGTAKHFAGVSQVTLSGSSYTPAEITSTLQSLVDLDAAVDAARAMTAAKVAAEAALMPSVSALITAYRAYIRAIFGDTPDALADFGLAPKTLTQVSPETRVIAAAKGRATRAARHTMGPKQKKGIKGVVPDVIAIPTTAPSPVVTTAPASPAAPANSGSSQSAPATSGNGSAAGAVTAHTIP